MKKTMITIISIIILMNMLIGCGKKDNNLYLSKEDNNYKKVNAVDGVLFAIPKKLTTAATALTKIDDEIEMESAITYSYKDGQNNYMLFNMDNFVIFVTNETKYNLQEFNTSSITNAIENNYTLGVRAEKTGKTLTYNKASSNGVNKFIAEVKSEVILSTEFYGNFVGKISYIKQNDKEYSLFVGVAGENYSNINEESKEIINYVSKSFKINETTAVKNTNFEVLKEVVNPQAISENVIVDTVPDKESISENEMISENQPISESENVIIEHPEKIEGEPLPVEPKEMVSNNEIVKDKPKTTENKKKGISITNQKINKSDSKIKLSSIYSMLKIGDAGYLNVFSSMSKKMETACITVEKVFTGKEAINLIKNYCSQSEALYEYKDAQEGTSWQAIKYSVDYNSCTTTENYVPYVNIKIRGVDGEKLNYRGISYTKKTHDIKTKVMNEGPLYSDYYVFYEIPNGCTEYLIEAGEGTITNAPYGIMAAYYLVKQ